MGWPNWVLSSLREYLSREPAPIERIEYALAQLSAIQINSNLAKGSPAKKTADLLMFRDAWKKEEDEGEEGSIEEFATAIGAVRRRK